MKIRDKYGNVVGEVEDNSGGGGGDGCLGSIGGFVVLLIILAFVLRSCGLNV